MEWPAVIRSGNISAPGRVKAALLGLYSPLDRLDSRVGVILLFMNQPLLALMSSM
jgi:hypothetical protein